jgi:hypothetical protein
MSIELDRPGREVAARLPLTVANTRAGKLVARPFKRERR